MNSYIITRICDQNQLVSTNVTKEPKKHHCHANAKRSYQTTKVLKLAPAFANVLKPAYHQSGK